MTNHPAPFRVAAATVLATAILGLAGCANPFAAEVIPAAEVGTDTSTPAVSAEAPTLSVATDTDPSAWRPDQPIVVNAAAGTLTEVSVTSADGDDLAGSLSEDQKHWQSSGVLLPGTTYEVRATMVGSDPTRTATETLTIETVESAEDFRALISPRDGATVGVGMPILVTFTAPVEESRRADVQRALGVTSSKDVEGAWNWVSDTKVQYRTKEYWPAKTEVSVTADLAGVQASADVWGDQDKKVDFEIGRSVVSVVDVKSHQLTVTIDGKVARTIPVTTGKDGFLTRGGTRVISEKLEETRMDAASTGITQDDPEYYNLDVRYAMRMTNSGEFIHAAPWSVGSQGYANVSHGCTGMSDANAQWLFNFTLIGDPAEFVGSTFPVQAYQTIGCWTYSWEDWQLQSAL